MEASVSSDQLIDLVFLVALLCLVAFAAVVFGIVWRTWFKQRNTPDKPD